MADLLADADIFIDHLRGHRRFDPADEEVAYSVVTRAALFAGKGADDDAIALLLAPFAETAIDRNVAARAGRLRRAIALALPDALIAATGLSGGLVLPTRNTSDFNSVAGPDVRMP
jgi:predicted nucleic acid-binding protein